MRSSKMLMRALVMLMVCAMLVGSACAEGIAPVTVTVEAPIITEEATLDGLTNDQLYQGYVNRLFGLTPTIAGSRNNREKLNEMEQGVYDALKAAVNAIATGQSESSVVTLDGEALGVRKYWYQDSFTTPIYDWDTGVWIDSEEVWATTAAYYEGRCDTSKVIKTLMSDDPFAFYWLNNKAKYNFTTISRPGYETKFEQVNGEYVFWVEAKTDINFIFQVDSLYVGTTTTSLNTAMTSAANRSMQTAHNIVAAAANLSDMEKMTYYMQEIRKLSEYNTPASLEGYVGSSAPWQLIYVFDGDPDTMVVCEGYSKAFKYLCDNTNFADKSTWVYTVGGTMNGGAHMWNMVRNASGYHMVDVTNCLTSGATDTTLFFSEPISGSMDAGYVFKRADEHIVPQDITYVYDASTKQLYTREELTVTSSLDEPDVVEHEITLRVGDKVKLWDSELGISPVVGISSLKSMSYIGTDVVSMTGSGVLTAIKSGVATVKLTGDGEVAEITVHVLSGVNTLVLPEQLTEIEEAAFSGTAAFCVVLPEGLETVASAAFSGMNDLGMIVIPQGVSEDALAGLPTGETVLWLCRGTTEAAWAKANGAFYLLMN